MAITCDNNSKTAHPSCWTSRISRYDTTDERGFNCLTHLLRSILGSGTSSCVLLTEAAVRPPKYGVAAQPIRRAPKPLLTNSTAAAGALRGRAVRVRAAPQTAP